MMTKDEIEADLVSLKEIRDAVEHGWKDHAFQLIDDWIDELEKKAKEAE